MSDAPATPEWRSTRERGSILGIKALVFFATMFGRAPARVIVALVAFYFAVFSRRARRAVHDYRRRLGLPTGFGAAYRQILRFAQCALDTLFFLRGKTKYFTVSRNGYELLAKLRDDRQSAILLGAHLGSFAAMRMQGAREDLRLHPVVYTKHARRFNQVIEELDPASKISLIEMGDGGEMDFMLAIREKLEDGALVAILGDRVQAGKKNVTVDFLGGKAELPAGPYLLASLLRCPVYFTAGVYRGGGHYELYCIPFADRVVLPRGKREEGIQAYAQQYANLLERFCRDAPDNWFNFYDFWGESDASEPRARPSDGAPPRARAIASSDLDEPPRPARHEHEVLQPAASEGEAMTQGSSEPAAGVRPS